MKGIEGIRKRLVTVISKRHGEVNPQVLREVSKKAGISYTTLARLVFYRAEKRTMTCRLATLNAIGLALDASPIWLRDGQGAQQLGFWPILTASKAEAMADEPLECLSTVIEFLRELPDHIVTRACRAAVAAAIEVVIANGEGAPAAAYRSLMHLDAMHRGLKKVALSAG